MAKTGLRLRVHPAAARKLESGIAAAQTFIDRAVLRFCTVRMPRQSGALIASGAALTTPGEGKVRFGTRYAARQYYHTAKSRPYDAERGAAWFERGKKAEAPRVLQGAQATIERGR